MYVCMLCVLCMHVHVRGCMHACVHAWYIIIVYYYHRVGIIIGYLWYYHTVGRLPRVARLYNHRVGILYKYRDELILHRRNTLQMGKYLALGTLSRILNTTIVFYC